MVSFAVRYCIVFYKKEIFDFCNEKGISAAVLGISAQYWCRSSDHKCSEDFSLVLLDIPAIAEELLFLLNITGSRVNMGFGRLIIVLILLGLCFKI